MEALKHLYYAMWAQMAGWPLPVRAALVLAILFLIGWPVAAKLLPRALSAIGFLLDYGLKGLYIAVSFLCSFPISQGAARLQRFVDAFATRAERGCDSLNKWRQQQWKGHKCVHPMWMALTYLIVFCMVAAPQALKNKVDPAYFTYFTGVQRMYSRLEKKPLETAAAYRPLIQKKAVEITDQEVIGLSAQGKKGANLRSGPGTNYAVLRELKGDVTMTYVSGKETYRKGEWYHVKVSGKKPISGWIHQSMIELPKTDKASHGTGK